ncbi:MAG: PIG-L family deacetylase [Opitutaceae bacterium]|nr:PIG-L family deacetylase [Opitutaceae bacterium]
MSPKVALAIAAHPDDIEFMMAGTLLLLRAAGWEIHYLNVANGSLGSVTMSAARARVTRAREARAAARILGAHFHASLVDDLGVYYEPKLLGRLAAIVRDVKPGVVLTHSLQDYMEDHMNTARLAVSAAFTRGMPNYATRPRRGPVEGDLTVYHGMPHTLRDGMGRRVRPESYVNVTGVHATKLEALSAHRSQQNWLDVSQGMSSYLRTMEDMSRELGTMSRRFRYAEGWRRHNFAGFCAPDADPLRDALGKNYLRNPGYARWIEMGTG